MQVIPHQPIPGRVARAVRSATSLYGAFVIAKKMMGPLAPSKSDIEYIWNSGKKYYSSKKKSRPKSYGRRALPKQVKGLKNQVKELKRLAESDMGVHIHRIRNTSVVNCSVNAIEHGSWIMNDITTLEAVLSNLKYYDPSNPATLLSADGASGTFQKEFYFKRLSAKFMLRNNYQIPCKGVIYTVQSKEDTNITSTTAFTNGLTDVGAPTSSSPLVHLTDSVQFNDLYKIVDSKKFRLNPGQEVSVFWKGNSFQYDPSLSDSHNLTFQRRNQDCQIVVRLEGCLSHDTVISDRTTNQASCDVLYDRTYEVHYAAGADLKQITIDNNAATAFTNSGVCSSMPVSDNLAYSKA